MKVKKMSKEQKIIEKLKKCNKSLRNELNYLIYMMNGDLPDYEDMTTEWKRFDVKYRDLG
jgi:hypothetical protein